MSAKDREFIVSLIDNEGLSLDDKEMILSKSPFYRYLYRTYYPVIRNSRIQIISKDSIQKVIVTQVPVGFVAAAPSVSKANVYSPEPAGTHFVAPFQRDCK